MKCPHCHETLLLTERQGIEIDYCPACRGVWLDRGELDKIIERAAAPMGVGVSPVRKDERDHGYGPKHKHKKRESFWGELFDFD
jgi:Zn-finger nucleic acid-binding protein